MKTSLSLLTKRTVLRKTHKASDFTPSISSLYPDPGPRGAPHYSGVNEENPTEVQESGIEVVYCLWRTFFFLSIRHEHYAPEAAGGRVLGRPAPSCASNAITQEPSREAPEAHPLEDQLVKAPPRKREQVLGQMRAAALENDRERNTWQVC